MKGSHLVCLCPALCLNVNTFLEYLKNPTLPKVVNTDMADKMVPALSGRGADFHEGCFLLKMCLYCVSTISVGKIELMLFLLQKPRGASLKGWKCTSGIQHFSQNYHRREKINSNNLFTWFICGHGTNCKCLVLNNVTFDCVITTQLWGHRSSLVRPSRSRKFTCFSLQIVSQYSLQNANVNIWLVSRGQ